MQAGARIQDVVDQLRPHGLTLQNFASIREQSVGGFTQVASCALLPPAAPMPGLLACFGELQCMLVLLLVESPPKWDMLVLCSHPHLQPHTMIVTHGAVQETFAPGQVSAHGTGASIPPVDEQVVGLTVVTPGRGTLCLSLQVSWAAFAKHV